jgi:hypothetical protein
VNNTSVAEPVSAPLEPASTKIESERLADPFRGWLWRTLLLTVAMSCAFVWVTVRTDLLGLHGRSDVRIHAVSRFSIYLMAYRFIPDNFNGAIIFSNISEERTLAEEVLKRGHLKIVVLDLCPSLLATHSSKSAYMTPHDYWSSFGSIQTMLIYLQVARDALGHPGAGAVFYDPYGRARIPLFPAPLTRVMQVELAIDPIATRDLHGLVDDLNAKGVKVYVIFSPMYRPKWDAQREELSDWQSKVMSGFAPGELEVIDLPEQVKKPLQANRENFPDYTHLSPSASDTVMESLGTILGDETKPDSAIEAH